MVSYVICFSRTETFPCGVEIIALEYPFAKIAIKNEIVLFFKKKKQKKGDRPNDNLSPRRVGCSKMILDI